MRCKSTDFQKRFGRKKVVVDDDKIEDILCGRCNVWKTGLN